MGELICAVDIGNSNITVGIYKKNQKPQIINTFRLSSDMMKTEDEYAVLILDILKLFEIPKDDRRLLYIIGCPSSSRNI